MSGKGLRIDDVDDVDGVMSCSSVSVIDEALDEPHSVMEHDVGNPDATFVADVTDGNVTQAEQESTTNFDEHNEEQQENTSIDRGGSVVSALGMCSSSCGVTSNSNNNKESDFATCRSILLDPESLPQYSKAPSLMNDDRSYQSSSTTKPDPPPSVADDKEVVTLLDSMEHVESSHHAEEKSLNVMNEGITVDASRTGNATTSSDHLVPSSVQLETVTSTSISPPMSKDDDVTEEIAPVNYDGSSIQNNANIEDEVNTPTLNDATLDEVDTSAFIVPREAGVTVGPDNLLLLPAVDEERHHHQIPARSSYSSAPFAVHPQQHLIPVSALDRASISSRHHGVIGQNDRRKIELRLQEEVLMKTSHKRNNSLLGSIRKSSTRMFGRPGPEQPCFPVYKNVDRGTISVSWYPGTSTLELYQHVRRTVARKVKSDGSAKDIHDIRILDESSDPPEGTSMFEGYSSFDIHGFLLSLSCE